MYVCVCNAVSDKDILEAVNNGAINLSDIQSQLGAGTGCGACREFTQELINQTINQDSSFSDLAYSV